MPIRNDERLLVQAVVDFAAGNGLSLHRLSHDWLLVLQQGERRHSVFGYDIGLNSATCLRVCNDKAASFDVLRAAGLAMIEHRLFLEPIMHRFTGQPGNWSAMLAAFRDFGGDVVVKANEGTSGNDVHRVQSAAELERIAHLLLTSCRSIALSPFTRIRAEKRFVILEGQIRLAYAKDRPTVTGDGVQRLRDLVARAMSPDQAEGFGEWLGARTAAELDRVPAKGERVPVGWRHNLGHGAAPLELDPDAGSERAAAQLARSAAAATGLRFGSVDVVEREGDTPAVMEINAGVMLEHYGQASVDRRAVALALYRAALDRLLVDGPFAPGPEGR